VSQLLEIGCDDVRPGSWCVVRHVVAYDAPLPARPVPADARALGCASDRVGGAQDGATAIRTSTYSMRSFLLTLVPVLSHIQRPLGADQVVSASDASNLDDDNLARVREDAGGRRYPSVRVSRAPALLHQAAHRTSGRCNWIPDTIWRFRRAEGHSHSKPKEDQS
jgi:hypothetical protein